MAAAPTHPPTAVNEHPAVSLIALCVRVIPIRAVVGGEDGGPVAWATLLLTTTTEEARAVYQPKVLNSLGRWLCRCKADPWPGQPAGRDRGGRVPGTQNTRIRHSGLHFGGLAKPTAVMYLGASHYSAALLHAMKSAREREKNLDRSFLA